ncbi:pyridoxamine 5'-phosphate oxidase family protein [Aureimonas populi]|uniref:Pyridoxamine 5'-phosphate oxidase family protein n=1 Tax=Aureimonas populi TaxID=1701758 RepID=A0ABW5CM02_9HYPH|nr:pyridoxamine 5'-phosphate oxidase family protein [Aureimonas populi]
MSQMTLSDLSQAMRGIDFCMLSSKSAGGDIAARPMSNNGDVDFDGDSFFFAYEEARTISDIEHDPKVGLGFQGKAGLLGGPPLFIAIEGTAELIRDKSAFEAHWTPELNYWFKNGVDTPNIVLIKVRATRAHYWNGEDEGEIALDSAALA